MWISVVSSERGQKRNPNRWILLANMFLLDRRRKWKVIQCIYPIAFKCFEHERFFHVDHVLTTYHRYGSEYWEKRRAKSRVLFKCMCAWGCECVQMIQLIYLKIGLSQTAHRKKEYETSNGNRSIKKWKRQLTTTANTVKRWWKSIPPIIMYHWRINGGKNCTHKTHTHSTTQKPSERME